MLFVTLIKKSITAKSNSQTPPREKLPCPPHCFHLFCIHLYRNQAGFSGAERRCWSTCQKPALYLMVIWGLMLKWLNSIGKQTWHRSRKPTQRFVLMPGINNGQSYNSLPINIILGHFWLWVWFLNQNTILDILIYPISLSFFLF